MNTASLKQNNARASKENEEVVIFKAYSRVCFVAFSGIILSVVLFLLTLNQNLRAIESDFRHDVGTKILSLHHKIEILDQFWKDIQAFYASSREIEREEFISFSVSALKHNELLFIGWIPVETEPVTEDAVFSVAGTQKEDEQFRGFLMQEAFISELMERIRQLQSMEIRVVPAPFLKNGTEQKIIVAALPTFTRGRQGQEQRMSGITVTILDAHVLFNAVFPEPGKEDIFIYLVDPEDDSRFLLFEHYNDPDLVPEVMEKLREIRPALSVTRTLPFGSGVLEIGASPSFSYMSESVGWSPWMALFSGLILTAFTALWFYQQISRTLAVQKIVEEKTYALASSEQRIRSIIDHALDAIVTINEQGDIIEWNRQAEAVFGWPGEEVMGKKMAGIIIPERYRARHIRGIQNFLADGTSNILNRHIEIEALRRDGSVFPVELSVTEQKIGNQYNFTAFIRDITVRKMAEDERRHYMQSLEDSNRELDDFAYIASHDLKEPLRGLHNFSRFLLEDYEDRLDGEGKNMLHTIAALTKRMDALLSSLLHYSRLGRTELSVRETDLNEIVRDAVTMYAAKIKGTGTDVKIVNELPLVVCDHVRIAEVFQNLIGNALKYNDKTENLVEIGCREDHPDCAGETVYFVRDNGIGIDKENLDSIFKIFRRLHAQDAYGGGTGSGLTIAKKIIARHGGHIWAESPGKGQGTTFFFTIPPPAV